MTYNPGPLPDRLYIGFDAWITHKGRVYRVTVDQDTDMGPPWKEHDGHGPVSDWTTRAKRPCELVLSTDRHSRRYYDFAAACRQARAEGWNAAPYDIPGETRGQQAARAVLADYQHLKAWCDDRWTWAGVTVTDEETGESESLWGIEDTEGGKYLVETAIELAEELAARAEAELAVWQAEQAEAMAAAIAEARPDLHPCYV
jgi:hypothetical protein